MSVMASTLGLGILISLHDQASKGLELLKNRVSGLKNVSEDMVKSFDAGLKQLAGGIASVYAGMQGFSLLKNVFGSSIQTAVDFEYAMARVKAVSNATEEAFNALQKQARDLGRETRYTAIQAANSQELLARAGFDYREIIASMPGLLNMANAEGMELANAADIASNTLRGFGLQAEEMNKVADILAKTSSITNTSIATLGESFKYIAPNARVLGVSIEEIAAMVGVLGDVGIKGGQAGNYLKMAFNRLASQPARTKKVLEELGVTAIDSNGNMLEMGVIMEQLAAKIQNLGTAKKSKALSDLFGQYAAPGMTSLLEAYDTGKLAKKLNEIKTQSAGAAKKMADVMNDTAQGAIWRMESAFESLRNTVGDTLKKAFRGLIEWITDLAARIDKFMQEHPILTKAIIRTTALILALVSALLLVGGAILAFRGLSKIFLLLKIRALDTLRTITGGTGSLGKAFLLLTSRALYFATVAGLVYYAWRKNLFGIRNLFTIVTEGFKMMINASKDGITEVDAKLADSLKKAGLWDYAVNMGKIFWRIRQLWEGVVEGFEAGVKRIAEIFNYVGDIIASIFQPISDYTQALGLTNILADTSTNTWRDWGKVIGEFVPIIFGIIVAFKLLKIVGGILTWMTVKITALNALATTNPWAFAFRIALMALMALYFYSEDFRNLVNNVFREIGKVIEGVFTSILGVCQTVIGLLTLDFEKMREGIKNIFGGIFSGDFLLVLAKIIGLFTFILITGKSLLGLVSIFKTISIAASGVFTGLWTSITGIVSGIWGTLTAAFSGLGGLLLNPITLVIIGVIALIVLLYTYWDEFKNWFMGLWQSFAETFIGVLELIVGFIQFVIGLITLDWETMCEGMGMMFEGLKKIVKGVFDFVMKIIDGIGSAIMWVLEKLGIIESKKIEIAPNEAVSTGLNESNNKAQEFAAAFSGTKPKAEPKPIQPLSFSQTGQIPEIQERIIKQPIKIEPSAPILAQQNANQASFSGQAISGAMNENFFKINNDTKVDVKIQPSNTIINIDGDRVGEAVSQYIVRQNVRQGASEIE